MSKKTIGALTALTLAAAAFVPTVAFGGGRAASTHTVVLKAFRFRPGNLTIRRGDSIAWRWEDGGEEHNVTSRSFHSRTITRGSYTVRFTHTGTFNYRCTLHESEGMRGKIVVH